MNSQIKFGRPERAVPRLLQLGRWRPRHRPEDADNVTLVVIQRLNQKLSEEMKRRDAENVELKKASPT